MERKRLVLPRAPGRPRSDEAHAAILTAAIAHVREVGYDATAMDAIAARAGVGKATLYRRWSSKEALVAEAVGRIVRAIPTPDTGDTAADLTALLRHSLGLYRDPQTAALLSGLVAAMARSEAIAAALRGGFLATRRAAFLTVLTRAVRRGDLRTGLDLELVVDALTGTLFYRFMLTGAATDDATIRRLVKLMLRGLTRAGST